MSKTTSPNGGDVTAEQPTRISEHGNLIEVAALRGFLMRLLADDAVADQVAELLFDHVVRGRYHPTVVADSLSALIDKMLQVPTPEDWRAVTDDLIAAARELDAGRPGAGETRTAPARANDEAGR